ncbi:MAG TPA: hypothetical protein PLE54_04255 [Burkholderiaceae bacterium]|nr:hypothetical protein [Burkholderiaceae bacterium]HQR69789.1 hypothetical protein [Burkholderiaceae bacterium]
MQATVRQHGGDAQQLADAWLAVHAGERCAVIVEGAFVPLEAPSGVTVERLAGGCPCCLGQVPLRVALVRLVRAVRPDALLLLLSQGDHAERVRALLADGSLGVRFVVE